MEKIEKISIEDFISMFVAVGYLQEQRLFSIKSLENYLCFFYGIDNDTITKLNEIIKKMEEAKMISKVGNYEGLFRIGDNIPFKNIIASNFEYTDGMIDFFYSYNSYSVPNTNLISKEDSDIKMQKK